MKQYALFVTVNNYTDGKIWDIQSAAPFHNTYEL